jgi:hypothetical protein
LIKKERYREEVSMIVIGKLSQWGNKGAAWTRQVLPVSVSPATTTRTTSPPRLTPSIEEEEEEEEEETLFSLILLPGQEKILTVCQSIKTILYQKKYQNNFIFLTTSIKTIVSLFFLTLQFPVIKDFDRKIIKV